MLRVVLVPVDRDAAQVEGGDGGGVHVHRVPEITPVGIPQYLPEVSSKLPLDWSPDGKLSGATVAQCGLQIKSGSEMLRLLEKKHIFSVDAPKWEYFGK